MNTSDGATQFEVSFIHEDRRVQARGELTPEQVQAISDLASKNNIPALGLMLITQGSPAGSAEHLVETITDAMEDEAGGGEWDKVRELAGKIDDAAQGCADCKRLLVEFIWNNGGGDDNLFGQNFAVDGAGPANEALVDEFISALEQAGGDAFYDFGVSVGDGSDAAMSIEELVDFLEENNDEDEHLAALAGILAPAPAVAPARMGMR